MKIPTDRLRGQWSRSGFTLVELLVVIALILVLVTLTASATIRFMGVQPEKNTITTVQKVATLFDRHWKAVIEKANKEPIPPAFSNTWLTGIAGNDPTRLRVIWIKLRLKQEFPMSFAEVRAPTIPLPALPTYVQKLQGVANGTRWSENSACLLMALSQNRGGINVNPEDDLGAGAIADTDNNGVKEIVDGWGTPIIFFRWPTGNPDVDSTNPAPASSMEARKFRDPEDPQGLLLTPTWNIPVNRNLFETTWGLHKISKAGNPYEYYSVPVIVSAGPDQQFGLDMTDVTMPPPPWTMAILNPQQETDNIYSYRLRLGGSK